MKKKKSEKMKKIANKAEKMNELIKKVNIII